MAKVEFSDGFTLNSLPRHISQIISLWGIVLLSMSYLVAARFKFLEHIYGGLDKVFKLHTQISRAAYLLILLHPILLIFDNLDNFEYMITLIVPGIDTWAKTFGITSLVLYTVFVFLSIYRFFPYNVWKFIHSFIGIPFLFAGLHALNAESDVKYYEPLYDWIVIWIFVGVIAYCYKTLLYKHLGPRLRYVVDRVVRTGDITDVYMLPKDRRIDFEPGEFIFVSFQNNKHIPSESHPFGISSDLSKEYLRFTFKVLGDYTTTLQKYVKKGNEVDVYGPYGEFTSYVFSSYKKQIWIAGGIGVTPFLSMLAYESKNSDKKQINFFYCNKEQKDAAHFDEIMEIMKNTDDNIKLNSHCSVTQGRITAEMIKQQVGKDLKNNLILICGPIPMMQALRKDLIKLGAKKENIVFEEFNFV